MVKPKSEGNNTADENGTPLWRMAPSPHGPYWVEGMKLGYQDAGSWTLFNSTPVDRRKAAWLYAQFTVSKSVSLKKSHVGLTIIRDSDIRDKSFTERAPKLGGLIEFYRSPDRVRGRRPASTSPTIRSSRSCGGNRSAMSIPGRSRRSRRWTGWPARWTRSWRAWRRSTKRRTYGGCGPRLNPEKDPSEWLASRTALAEARQ